jgi:hypothetical protein
MPIGVGNSQNGHSESANLNTANSSFAGRGKEPYKIKVFGGNVVGRRVAVRGGGALICVCDV